MRASLSDIKHGYYGLKQLAFDSFISGDNSKAVQYVDHCVKLANQYNWIYSDVELEELLEKISKKTVKVGTVEEYRANEDNWVFFDDYCTSYVLALQWMKALSKTGKSILYITSQFSFKNRRDKCVLQDIEMLPNVTVDVVPNGKYFERVNYLYNSIVGFQASKIILHKAMNSIVQLPLFVLPKPIQRYNINLGDQFFWLGSKSIDYNIEFRPFGATVSLQKRGLKKEQLLMVPFYPANENRPFEGFPEECEGKLVLFSGGDYYKTWDEKNTFRRLVKQVLERHDDVVFLFATKKNPFGRKDSAGFIKENHFENRFFHISYRQDIYQVFAHCDIYFGTTPISGSLMSQLAAINSKPILQYYPPNTPDDETEQAICINDKFQISFSNEKDFLEEADKLIKDKSYRQKQGERLNKAMVSEAQFDELVATTLKTNKSQMDFEFLQFDYGVLESRWMFLEKSGFTNAGAYLYSLLGKKLCFKYAKALFFKENFNRIMAKYGTARR